MQQVKKFLEETIGGNVKIQDGSIKTTVKQLNGNDIMNLSSLYELKGTKDVRVKRSGVNVTVIVTAKE